MPDDAEVYCIAIGLIILVLALIFVLIEPTAMPDGWLMPRRTFRMSNPPLRSEFLTPPKALRMTQIVPMSFKHLERSVQAVRMHARGPSLSLVIPIAYSHEDQGFVARVRIGGSNVYVVLDSGSSGLTVASSQCIKEELCTARDAGYDPDASPTSVKMDDHVVRYGSLKVDATRFRDTFAFRALQDLSRCASTPPALTNDSTTGEVFLKDVELSAANQMDGTDSNIVGLMMPTNGSKQTFLGAVYSQLPIERSWAVSLGTNGLGWLVLGALPSDCAMRDPVYVPVSRDYTYLGAYVLDVVLMRAGKEGSMHVMEDFPRHIILDTGTAETYVTARYVPAFERAGFVDAHGVGGN
jgi:hypothetical protein